MTATGRGEAFGAVTLVNATATGIGCSLAIQAKTHARWTWHEGAVVMRGTPDDALVQAVLAVAQRRFGETRAADIEVLCPFPPSRGLKTSSSVAAALLRAAAEAAGQPLRNPEVETMAVQACRDAQVTLTGALDDQLAVVRGGCHIADNRAGKVLHSLPSPHAHVAIWVPESAIPKSAAAGVDVQSAAADASEAVRLLHDGRLGDAMTLNGRAFTRAYRAAGLPVNDQPAEVALASGAQGAGLSGTGPAVAALFSRPVELPSVPGGTWMWTQVAA